MRVVNGGVKKVIAFSATPAPAQRSEPASAMGGTVSRLGFAGSGKQVEQEASDIAGLDQDDADMLAVVSACARLRTLSPSASHRIYRPFL